MFVYNLKLNGCNLFKILLAIIILIVICLCGVVAYKIYIASINNLNESIFESAESAVNLSLTLLGTTCLWSGIMEVASKTRIIDYFF